MIIIEPPTRASLEMLLYAIIKQTGRDRVLLRPSDLVMPGLRGFDLVVERSPEDDTVIVRIRDK
jgi:hypothetical protein